MFCAVGCSACYFFFKLIIDLREARGKVLRFLGANTTIITSDLLASNGLILTSHAFLFSFFCPSFDHFLTLVLAPMFVCLSSLRERTADWCLLMSGPLFVLCQVTLHMLQWGHWELNPSLLVHLRWAWNVYVSAFGVHTFCLMACAIFLGEGNAEVIYEGSWDGCCA